MNEAVLLGEFDVILGCGDFRLGPPLADDGVCGLIGADGTSVVGEVRDVEKQVGLL